MQTIIKIIINGRIFMIIPFLGLPGIVYIEEVSDKFPYKKQR
jgi:hypothetical protein